MDGGNGWRKGTKRDKRKGMSFREDGNDGDFWAREGVIDGKGAAKWRRMRSGEPEERGKRGTEKWDRPDGTEVGRHEYVNTGSGFDELDQSGKEGSREPEKNRGYGPWRGRSSLEAQGEK